MDARVHTTRGPRTWGRTSDHALTSTSPAATSVATASPTRTARQRSTLAAAAVRIVTITEPGTDPPRTATVAPAAPSYVQPSAARYASTFVPGVKRATALRTPCS